MKVSLILILIALSSNTFSENLRLIGVKSIPTGTVFKETELGGLSGLAFSKEKNILYAVSDDRSQKNPARFYEFSITLNEKNFDLSPTNVVFVKNKEDKTFPVKTVDFEGITLVKDRLYITSEGDTNQSPPLNPELFVFDLTGKLQSNITLPDHFLLSKENDSKGVRNNLALESLSSLEDGSLIAFANEDALMQDGSITTPTFGSRVRVCFLKDNQAVKEVAYDLEKVPSIALAGLSVGENGLSEILLLDEKTFYSLERSFLPLQKRNIIKIFKNTITSETTNTLNTNVLKTNAYKAPEKTLLINLDDILSTFPKEPKDEQKLDNIEGISFGPTLPNGNKTLILVSDNNFNKGQRTLFIAFEILP